MAIDGYIARDDRVVWRDIAGEVIIAERDNSKIRTLNKVAGIIWTLADGTKSMDDIALAICDKYDVTREEALADSEEFCRELIKERLVSLRPVPEMTGGFTG